MIVLGRIVAPFGVRGWVKVHPFGDDPVSWGGMSHWWLGSAPEWQPYRVLECAPHGQGLIVRFEGVGDRTAAERLRGLYVAAPREALPANAQNEYYWADLIGLEVMNLADESLGRVAELLTTGAHEVLCVRDEAGGEHLLPFVASVVRDVDLKSGRIRVDWGRDW